MIQIKFSAMTCRRARLHENARQPLIDMFARQTRHGLGSQLIIFIDIAKIYVHVQHRNDMRMYQYMYLVKASYTSGFIIVKISAIDLLYASS